MVCEDCGFSAQFVLKIRIVLYKSFTLCYNNKNSMRGIFTCKEMQISWSSMFMYEYILQFL